MTPLEHVHLAAAYVALSNAHRLDHVGRLFAPDAVYASANVGTFEGSKAIATMMASFFARFPDVHWAVERYEPAGEGAVAFDFVMTGTSADDGAAMERRGRETIEFDSLGSISRIHVS